MSALIGGGPAGGLSAGIEEVRKNWGWFVGLGVLLIVLGIVALGAAIPATFIAVSVAGWIFLFSGVLELVHAFMRKAWKGFFLDLLGGVLYFVVGLLLILNPGKAALALTLLFALLLILGGVSRVVVDPEGLPYRAEVLAWVRAARARGDRVVLATASDVLLAAPVAGHLAAFDADPSHVKSTTEEMGVPVHHVDELGNYAREHGVRMAIIAVPESAGQAVADTLVEAGVAAVLNFSPAVLSVPDEVVVNHVDLAAELGSLGFFAN